MPTSIWELLDSVAQICRMSALPSVQFSPNREREDWTSETVDVFPVYQVSPNNTGYSPETSPVMPPLPGCFLTSQISPGLDFPPPGATGSFDSLLVDDLLNQTTDLLHLSPPLLPLPDDLLLFTCVSATRGAVCLDCLFPTGLVPGGTLRRVLHAV